MLCSSVFFFKQKTAYEMRISDWSSDVCSSDLGDLARGQAGQVVGLLDHGHAVDEVDEADETGDLRHDRVVMRIPVRDRLPGLDRGAVLDVDGGAVGQIVAFALAAVCVEHRQFARTRHRDQVATGMGDGLRSEENTSELQSLMRI